MSGHFQAVATALAAKALAGPLHAEQQHAAGRL
jgi:hypothetical protein